jgi:chemotaxis protein CheZ
MTKFGMSRAPSPAVEAAAAPPTRAEIAELVREVVTSLSGDLSPGELKLFQEVEGLARFIHAAKREIMDVRPGDIAAEHIPEATIELDAVVAATALATGEILDRAEQIDKIAAALDPVTGAKLNEAVTAIFEACNFQDITGQRITKVVKTLKYIEARVDGLVRIFGHDFAEMPSSVRRPEPEGDAALLHGPQLPENANSQEEIDAILAGLF